MLRLALIRMLAPLLLVVGCAGPDIAGKFVADDRSSAASNYYHVAGE